MRQPTPQGPLAGDPANSLPSRSSAATPSAPIFRRSACLAVCSIALALGARPAAALDLDLSAYRGKVVYVDFWASWCGPCRQSFPWLDGLVRGYAQKNLVVLGVNVDKDPARAQQFLDATPADFPIIYDPHGELATIYKVAGMPSAILIDRQGHVRFQHSGFSAKEKDQYEDEVRTLLNESSH